MKRNRFKYFLLLADLLAVVAAFRVAYLIRVELGLFRPDPWEPTFSNYFFSIALTLGAWIVIFILYGEYHFPASGESPLALSQLFTACVLLMAMVLAGMYLTKTYHSRLLFFLLSLLIPLFLFLTRVVYDRVLRRLRKYGIGLRRVVVVGQTELATELANRLRTHPELQYELAGFLHPATGRVAANGPRKPGEAPALAASSEEMARGLVERGVDELIFAIPIRRDTETLEFIAACQKLGVAVKLVPEYYELYTSQIESFTIDGIPIFELKEASPPPSFRVVKRTIDLVLVVLVLPLALLLGLVVAVILWVGLRRVFKRERRVGLGGRPFTMLRFAVSRAEEAPPSPSDTWPIRFARVLLRYSVSELPQVWNVLIGNMSLVGPRPETPERVRYYSTWHRRRLQLKPGITGLAQVHGLRGVDSTDLKTKYDLEYAANYTPFLDLALMLATVATLISRRNPSPHAEPSAPSGSFPGEPVHTRST